jgi:hypothetical protein
MLRPRCRVTQRKAKKWSANRHGNDNETRIEARTRLNVRKSFRLTLITMHVLRSHFPYQGRYQRRREVCEFVEKPRNAPLTRDVNDLNSG